MVWTKQDRAEQLAVIAVRMRVAGEDDDAWVLENMVNKYIEETITEREAEVEEAEAVEE